CDLLALVDKFIPVEDNISCDLLALVDKFIPVEDNISLLETTFDEDVVLMFVFPEDVMGSVNLTHLVLFIGVITIN
nr:hypothetical protein [Tanacetum cinerariifolium]